MSLGGRRGPQRHNNKKADGNQSGKWKSSGVTHSKVTLEGQLIENKQGEVGGEGWEATDRKSVIGNVKNLPHATNFR